MSFSYYFNYDDYGYDEYTSRTIEASIANLNKVFLSSSYEVAVSHMRNIKSSKYSNNIDGCDNNLHFDFAEFYLIGGKSNEELKAELARQFNSFYAEKRCLPNRIDFHQNMHKKFKLMKAINSSAALTEVVVRPIVQFPLHDNWVYSITKFIFTYLYQTIGQLIFRKIRFGDELVVTNVHMATKKKLRVLRRFTRIFKYKLLIPMHPHIYGNSEYVFMDLLTKYDEI